MNETILVASQHCKNVNLTTFQFFTRLICASASVNNRLSYDVAVIQWLTSCHKNRMTTRYITLGYWRVTS